jgi:preprotein translocase subunit SecG
MYALILVVHVIVAFFLIAVVLLQGGRGGLGETLGGAAAQSLFGGGANIVMTRITAVAAGLFMVTCLSLAALSTARGRSVIDRLSTESGGLPLTAPLPGFPTAETPPAPVPAEPAAPQPSVSAPSDTTAPAQATP